LLVPPLELSRRKAENFGNHKLPQKRLTARPTSAQLGPPSKTCELPFRREAWQRRLIVTIALNDSRASPSLQNYWWSWSLWQFHPPFHASFRCNSLKLLTSCCIVCSRIPVSKVTIPPRDLGFRIASLPQNRWKSFRPVIRQRPNVDILNVVARALLEFGLDPP